MKLQRLLSLTRQALDKYNLIEDGDRIAVGVSGGKDSLALLYALHHLQRFYPRKYELCAVTVNLGLGNMDLEPVRELCGEFGVPYTVIPTEIGKVLFDIRKESNPCSLCAKMRRGALHAAAEELDCNKVALGHHLDDAIETFYMNLWREGRIGCFSPVTELSDRGLTLIRPLLLATEQEVRCAVKEEGFPIVKSRCPADGVTTREDTKNFVRERCRTDRAFRQKTLHALQESGIDGWRPLHPARTSKKEDTAHADARI